MDRTSTAYHHLATFWSDVERRWIAQGKETKRRNREAAFTEERETIQVPVQWAELWRERFRDAVTLFSDTMDQVSDDVDRATFRPVQMYLFDLLVFAEGVLIPSQFAAFQADLWRSNEFKRWQRITDRFRQQTPRYKQWRKGYDAENAERRRAEPYRARQRASRMVRHWTARLAEVGAGSAEFYAVAAKLQAAEDVLRALSVVPVRDLVASAGSARAEDGSRDSHVSEGRCEDGDDFDGAEPSEDGTEADETYPLGADFDPLDVDPSEELARDPDGDRYLRDDDLG